MGLIARQLEAAGLRTVTLNFVRAIAERVQPPRTLLVPFPFGAPFGDPGNESLQLGVLREALALLETAEKPGIIIESGFRWKS